MAKSSLVVLFALIKDNKVLLEKRPIKGFTKHQYLIPGGAINEKIETLEDALKREMMEELGVIPLNFELLTQENIPGLNDNILKTLIVSSWQGKIASVILDKEDPFPLEWVEINKALDILPIKPTKRIVEALKKFLEKNGTN